MSDLRKRILTGGSGTPGGSSWFDDPIQNEDTPNVLTTSLTDAMRAGEDTSKKKKKAGVKKDDDDGGGSDNESTFSSVDLPREPVKLENLAIRQDPFMQCLSAACGFSTLSLESCFHTPPPWDACSYETYRPYLTPMPTAAFMETIKWIGDLTKHKQVVSISRCIANPRLSPVIAKMIGTLMRKSLMDNPLKTAYSKVTLATMDRDLRRAVESLEYHLQRNPSTLIHHVPRLRVFHDYGEKRGRFQAGV